jgi:cyclopropane fatty-acyl-phospholipid synthase-like methyltransferase
MGWRQIFNKSYNERKNHFKQKMEKIEELIYVGDLKIDFQNFKNSFQTFLNYNPKKILEIGCGNGSVLYLFHEKAAEVYGIDFSEEAIEQCKNNMSSQNFAVSEADKIPFFEKFDLILSNSTFQYFNDVEYAQNVIKNAVSFLNKDGIFFISDLFDEEKKEEYIKFRKKELNMSEKEWNNRYYKINHLFLNKEKIVSFIKEIGYDVEVVQPSSFLSNHKEYRFDLIIKQK